MFPSSRHNATTEAYNHGSIIENGGNKNNSIGFDTSVIVGVVMVMVVMLILLLLAGTVYNKKRKKRKGNSIVVMNSSLQIGYF